MKKLVEIRAHHLLCIPRFKGGSYDKEFTRHFRKICDLIRDSPKKRLKC